MANKKFGRRPIFVINGKVTRLRWCKIDPGTPAHNIDGIPIGGLLPSAELGYYDGTIGEMEDLDVEMIVRDSGRFLIRIDALPRPT